MKEDATDTQRGCRDEVYEQMSDADRGAMPSDLASLWDQWWEFRQAKSLVDRLVDGVSKAGKKLIRRVSIMPREDRGVATLVIVDGKEREKEYAIFHRGEYAFRSLVMALWRADQDDADWRLRERGHGGGRAAEEDSPFGSGAI